MDAQKFLGELPTTNMPPDSFRNPIHSQALRMTFAEVMQKSQKGMAKNPSPT